MQAVITASEAARRVGEAIATNEAELIEEAALEYQQAAMQLQKLHKKDAGGIGIEEKVGRYGSQDRDY